MNAVPPATSGRYWTSGGLDRICASSSGWNGISDAAKSIWPMM